MSDSSLVHTLETSDPPPLPSSYRNYRIAQSPDLYDCAVKLYSYLDADNEHSYIDRLEACRSRSWFARHDETGMVRVFTSTCKLRWCPLCSSARRNWLQTSVGSWLKTFDDPRFLTLTLKHSDKPLEDQIRLLYSHFRNLRRTKYFAENCRGGVWFFQLKKSKTDDLWHPHLHCVLDSEFMSHKLLSGLWERITLGSPVVDIRAVYDADKAADYVARYATSPADLTKLELDSTVEVFDAMHGRRIAGTWGTGRSVRMTPPKADDRDSWKHVGNWSTVTQTADCHEAAHLILKAWLSNSALPAGISMYPLEREINGYEPWPVKAEPEQAWLPFYNTS